MLTRNRKKDCKEPGESHYSHSETLKSPGPNTSNSTGTEAPEDFEGGMVLRSRGTKFSTRKSAATDGLCGEEFRGTKRKVESHSGASVSILQLSSLALAFIPERQTDFLRTRRDTPQNGRVFQAVQPVVLM